MQRKIVTWLTAAAGAAAIAFATLSTLNTHQASADDSNAPEFTLTDTHGNQVSLADYKGKYVVLEWLNFDCPCVKAHYDCRNMQTLQQTYTTKGVVWLSIVSSAPGKQGHYGPDDMNRIAAKRESAATAILLDSDGKVGRLFGARTTPHMFVINPEGMIIYKGAIDSNPTTDANTVKEAVNFVAKALDESMSGRPVTTAAMQPYGCSVKY